MRVNFILVDYENVQEIDFKVFESEEVRVVVFVGEDQAKLTTCLVLKMQALGNRASFLQIVGKGKNALDFVIAFTVGQLSVAEPGSFFHIISRDTGFDPLIRHLKERKIFAARHETIGEIPFVKSMSSETPRDRADAYIAKLREPKATKPRTRTTLSNAINAAFQKQLTEKELAAVLQSLESRKFIAMDGDRVSYPGLGV